MLWPVPVDWDNDKIAIDNRQSDPSWIYSMIRDGYHYKQVPTIVPAGTWWYWGN